MTTNNTKENLSRELVIIIEALRVAHQMTFAAVQMLVDEANDNAEKQLENQEDDYDPTDDMPRDDMDGDAESALTSAGFGVDESYEHDTPMGEDFGNGLDNE
jgi:hypothetical protein